MTSELKIEIRPESSILAKYKDYGYKLESVMSEFIDNSTQSFFDHKSQLKKVGVKQVKVEIDISPDLIRIKDNANGMNEKDFRRALKLDSPPEDTSGRNEQGMGLKTASTYLGMLWSVQTTELGSGKLFSADMDVNYIVKKSPENVIAKVFDTNKNEHYTIVEIKNLNQKITASKIKKMSTKIAEIYSRDIINNNVMIIINGEKLKYELPEIRKDEKGKEYRKQFKNSFTYDNKRYSYSGWVGIRKVGDTHSSGFTLLHKGRAVVTNYRPEELIGRSNTFPFQRIVGQIDMGDEWRVTHTKDGFIWDGGLEDELINHLKIKDKNGIGDLIYISSTLRNVDIDKTVKNKVIKKTQNTFKSLKDAKISLSKIKSKPSKVSNIKTNNSEDILSFEFQGKTYTFNIREENSITKKWIEIESTKKQNYYIVKVDFDMPYFHSILKKKTGGDYVGYEFARKLAATMALSSIVSKENGCKDGYMLINMLNSIIGVLK